MRAALASTAIGAVFCLAYGVTRGFGFGLPPYSFIYAVALGLVVGIGAYGALSIRSKWAIVALVLLSIAAGMTYANATRVRGPILSGGLPTAAPALKPTTAPAPTTPAVRQQP